MNRASDAAPSPDILQLPLVAFGRGVCGDLDAGLRREWLVTNGLGGYASGSLCGVATRRYHGLLVAALRPPVERTVLVGAANEVVSYSGAEFGLSAHEFGDGTITPRGFEYLESFRLEGMLPVWTFALGDALLERRLWMVRGQNTTLVRYRLVRASVPFTLAVTPLVTYRDFHALSKGGGMAPTVERIGLALRVRAFEGARPLRLSADRGGIERGGNWWWNFRHREESARGLDDWADLYAPGTFRCALEPGESLTLRYAADDGSMADSDAGLETAQLRQHALLGEASVERSTRLEQQLVLAADQFLVARESSPTASEAGRTVIAGYHWFNDWGRDTMIALPGLTLATGRTAEAATILRTFAHFISGGLCPNNFPDSADEEPGYNTADATLWYFLAVRDCVLATNDTALLNELLPVLEASIASHQQGTHHGIKVDPADGLLVADEPGVQLTWMDARVGDRVITPRAGKPVEINALWYNALLALAELERLLGRPAAERYEALATQALSSFRHRFWDRGRGYLADVVDGQDGDDYSLRPNQIYAVALPFPLLEPIQQRAVVDTVGRQLLTSYGLRTLDPADPRYQGRYGGDQAARDGAYHQGPAWTFLLGPFAEAHFRAYGDREAALRLLAPLEEHLLDAGLGTISELLEGEAPHLPRGCIAQAWGIACTLAALRRLQAVSGT